MIKNPKHFHLSAPSQLNQTIECDCVKKVKNTNSSCKTHDATKQLYSRGTELVYKTHDKSDQLFKESIKGNNIFQPKTIILNEETISNNSDVNPTGLEEDIGHNLHDVTSCQVYDNKCESKIIHEPNNAHIKRAIMVQNKHDKNDIDKTTTTYRARDNFVLYIQQLR